MTYVVTITGTGGAELVAGQTITGAAQRDVVVQNDLARVSFPSIPSHRGAHSFHRQIDGVWVNAFNSTYGDRLLWIDEFVADPDRTVILQATREIVEWAVIWDAHSVTHPAYWSDGTPIYPQSSAAPKQIATCKLWKVLCLRRGEDGYFVGVRTNPRTDAQLYPDHNNELAAFGDRSMGPGTLDSKVLFFSTGIATRHPRTAPDGAGSYHTWPGIDDPPGFINQPAGYPAEQIVGPWWAGDMPTGIPVCRFMIMEHRLEIGALQYAAGQLGSLVVVGINEEAEDNGLPKPYQLYLGAFPYAMDANPANEPTALATTQIVDRVPTDWPPAASTSLLAPPFVTLDEEGARSQMEQAIEAIIPSAFVYSAFKAFRESTSARGGIERWANASSSPSETFRYFAVRFLMSTSEAASEGTLDTVDGEISVAYPHGHDYGASSPSETATVDLEAIDAALAGLGSITVTPMGEAVTTDGDVTFGIYSFAAQFWSA